MDEFGLLERIHIPGPELLENQDEVYAYYDRVEAVAYSNIIDVTIEFLKHNQFDMAMTIVETATRRSKGFLFDLIEHIIKTTSFPAREAILHAIEEDQSQDKSKKYHPGISQVIIKKLDAERFCQTASMEELVLDFFHRLQHGTT
ncbi:unnamed protein product [Ambrosiozyma monospora]|uniref:Unnamed protein product n=1 Tax=Ambrosiozyma monospora TaxID=43982 RepID=A0ACB5U9W8_AMBMO|nr:unnamed protein product [Ambrosiozyma monospora]